MRSRKQNGALLVEAMVSFAIFLLASVSFYGLLANSRRAEAKASQTVAATAYARQLMESARLKGYSSLKVGTESGSRSVTTSRRGVLGKYVLKSLVTVYDGPDSGAKSVLVRVSWHQGEVSLESYVTP